MLGTGAGQPGDAMGLVKYSQTGTNLCPSCCSNLAGHNLRGKLPPSLVDLASLRILYVTLSTSLLQQ